MNVRKERVCFTFYVVSRYILVVHENKDKKNAGMNVLARLISCFQGVSAYKWKRYVDALIV